MADSLFCTAETNIALKQLYSNKKKKNRIELWTLIPILLSDLEMSWLFCASSLK